MLSSASLSLLRYFKISLKSRYLNKTVFQTLVTGAVMISSASCGMPVGYSAILLPQLALSNDSMRIDEEIGSWIGRLINFQFLLEKYTNDFERNVTTILSFRQILKVAEFYSNKIHIVHHLNDRQVNSGCKFQSTFGFYVKTILFFWLIRLQIVSFAFVNQTKKLSEVTTRILIGGIPVRHKQNGEIYIRNVNSINKLWRIFLRIQKAWKNHYLSGAQQSWCVTSFSGSMKKITRQDGKIYCSV